MNIAVFFFCINFKLTSIEQKTLIKQGSTHKNKSYNGLVHIFLPTLNLFSFIFTCLHTA